jgi:hypothetical protein
MREITHYLLPVSDACQTSVMGLLFCANEVKGSFQACRIGGYSVMSYNLPGCFLNRQGFRGDNESAATLRIEQAAEEGR